VAVAGVGSDVHDPWPFAAVVWLVAAAGATSAVFTAAAAGCAAACTPLAGAAGVCFCALAPEASTEIKFEKTYPTCPFFVSILEKINPYISTVKRSPQASEATVSCDRRGFEKTCVSSACFEQST